MKSKTLDETIFVHICSTKLYITIWKQYSWVWLSNSQKTTVACYQTCYTNSTVGSIYWRTSSLLQYSPKIAARHYACYTSNTNNKLAFFQNVLVFFDTVSFSKLLQELSSVSILPGLWIQYFRSWPLTTVPTLVPRLLVGGEKKSLVYTVRTCNLIGASLSEPHTSVTALRTRVSIYLSMDRPPTFIFYISAFKYFTMIES